MQDLQQGGSIVKTFFFVINEYLRNKLECFFRQIYELLVKKHRFLLQNLETFLFAHKESLTNKEECLFLASPFSQISFVKT
jgi:hypothetical protein